MKASDNEAAHAAAEKQFITEVLEGCRIYADTIGKTALPGGRSLIFLAAAGCRRLDGMVNMQLICNAGDDGLDELIRQLATERERRRGRA